MNKEKWSQNLKYLFLSITTVVILSGLVNQLGLKVLASQLPANPAAPTSAPAAPAADPTPTPVITVNPAANLSGSCSGGQSANYSWSPASKTGQTVTNYTLRLNKEPFADWMGPGDNAFQVGPVTSYSNTLATGKYGFSIQAGFSDGSTSATVNGPEFECAAPVRNTVSACGKSGVLASGYTLYTPASCSANQYLYVNVAGGYLSNACLAIPTGNSKTADGCGYTANTQAPTPTPVPAGAVAFACPVAGGTFMVNGSIISCQAQSQQQTQNNNQTVNNTIINPVLPVAATVARASSSRVAGVANVKELPKTGLPLMAWVISGLLPLGIGLKKFSGSEGEESEKTASHIWQMREYLKG